MYGYAHCRGERGFLFVNNPHFASRRAVVTLDASLGLNGKPGTLVKIVSLFPERSRVQGEGGAALRLGDSVEAWLRPFEVLMLEVRPAETGSPSLPVRSLSAQTAAGLGVALPLHEAPVAAGEEIAFADAVRFEQQGLRKKSHAYVTTLPAGEGAQPILAVAIRLRQGGAEWRYSPTVCEIVQAVAFVGGRRLQLVPVPDARQFGNTQNAGCSWVVYKARLPKQPAGQPLRLLLQAYLPDDVDAEVEAWVVRRWWQEYTRPMPDGYYGDAPS